MHVDACVRCGKCVDACVIGALEMVGKRMSAEEVMAVVRRDIPFYLESGGGMTLSGGEPLAQHAFSLALLEAARAEKLHTAIETTAFTSWQRLAALAPLVNLFLVDLKHTDDARHRALTGVSNRRILANIRRMVEAGWPIILRIPWVPRHNDETSFLDGLRALLASLPTPPMVDSGKPPYGKLKIHTSSISCLATRGRIFNPLRMGWKSTSCGTWGGWILF